MIEQQINNIINKGEGIDIEFIIAQHGVPDNLFETICAFLNRNGGHILLGVDDERNIKGINPEKAERYIKEIITTSNNPQKIFPPFFLSPENIQINSKSIICIFIPESSQSHSTAGKIYDRNNEGDFDITKNSAQLTALYQRKQQAFTENKIFPALQLSDFREDLFARIRKMATNRQPNHIWNELDNMELMKSASLYQKDYLAGQEGFTLAAVLLLGKDEVIHSILPYYETDAIVRIENKDRYDDRDEIRTNLIESYDRLMLFVQKHLPNKFYEAPDGERKDIRSLIFHEVIVNILGHREFSNPYPAKFIIENGKVYTENWSKPHGYGAIKPENFSPYFKNPNIARFFREINRFDKLGSGVRNIFKYVSLYTPDKSPELIEGDIFKIIIPVPLNISFVNFSNQLNNDLKISNKIKERLNVLIKEIAQNQGINRKELQKNLNYPLGSLKNDLEKLKINEFIEYKGSEKSGGYFLVEQNDTEK